MPGPPLPNELVLTAGAIERMLHGGQNEAGALLQIVNIKQPKPDDQRVFLMLSDGQGQTTAMTPPFTSGNSKVQMYSVIRVHDYAFTKAGVLSVSSFEHCGNATAKIGNPMDVVVNKSSAAPASAPRTNSSGSIRPQQPPQYAAGQPQSQAQSQSQSRAIPAAAKSNFPRSFGDLKVSDVTPLQHLNPYVARPTIRVRVMRKSDRREFTGPNRDPSRQSYEYCTLDLIDANRTEVRATLGGQYLDKHYGALEEGNCYLISRPSVKIITKDSSKPSTSSGIQLQFTSDTEVIPLPDDPAIPQCNYNFKKIADLVNLSEREACDVIGAVTRWGGLGAIEPKKKPGTQLPKRTVTIMDTSMKQIDVTLWDQIAVNCKQPDEAKRIVVLAFKNVRLSKFMGSLQLNAGFDSSTLLEPNIPEAVQLRAWYGRLSNEQRSGAECLSASSASSINANEHNGWVRQLIDVNLKENQTEMLVVRANVRFNVSEQGQGRAPFFQACGSPSSKTPSGLCGKKMSEVDHFGNLMCPDKHQGVWSTHWMLNTSLTDPSGVLNATCFDDVAKVFLDGLDAAGVAKLWDDGKLEEVHRIISERSGFNWVVKVKAQVRPWPFGDHLELLRRYQVVAAMPFDGDVKAIMAEYEKFEKTQKARAEAAAKAMASKQFAIAGANGYAANGYGPSNPGAPYSASNGYGPTASGGGAGAYALNRPPQSRFIPAGAPGSGWNGSSSQSQYSGSGGGGMNGNSNSNSQPQYSQSSDGFVDVG